jgi:pyruvate dehydrogenase E1 component beta subunit
MVREVISVAELLHGEGVSVEIIDLRTIAPMDVSTIIHSVQKTGRAVVVHEAHRTGGVGAEIVAQINEKALLSLEAPVERITGFDIVFPLARSEHWYLPTPERIMQGIQKVLSF